MILGHHTLIELHGCEPSLLRDVAAVRSLMLEAVRQSGGTYVTDVFHHFSPLGVSGVVVIAESHATIHTWPEHGCAALDVFTCGESFRHGVFVSAMRKGLGAQHIQSRTFERGGPHHRLMPQPTIRPSAGAEP